jgi:hypothetical protein
MKFLKTSIFTTIITSLAATSAFAHTGSHEAPLLANVVHWLTSPTHALLTVVGSAAIVTLIIKLKRNRS